MIPELDDNRLSALRSRAEARFYLACRDGLHKDVLVIHSAGWIYRDEGGRLREGEADFTIVAPRSGVFAVEVKGGGIAHDAASGRWYSVDRANVRHEIKDPFRQASKERHALLDQISGHTTWRQWCGRRLTMGHAVALPDIVDSAPLLGPDRPRATIAIGKDLGQLEPWFERLVKFWKQQGDDALGAEGVKLVESILRASVEVRPALRTALDEAEQSRIRLTENQAKILRIIGGRKRAIISGGAGTGKTLIAVEKARQLAHAGANVMLLCYNRPLADALASALEKEERISVSSFHQLCDRRVKQALEKTKRNLMREAEEAYPGESKKHRFEVQMPYALALSNEVLDEKYDAIVIDEAQDFSDEYWFSIEELLHDAATGYLYLFIDQNQSIYRRHGNLPIPDEPYFLTTNCRNTAPIHELAYVFYVGEQVDAPQLAGPAVGRDAVAGDESQADAISRRLRHWLKNEGLAPEDVAVLIAKKPKNNAYAALKARLTRDGVRSVIEVHGHSGAVLFDTVARFKGLEAQAVILWLGEDVVDDEQWETVYVGATRAKSLLWIVGSPRALDALASLRSS